jgi:hypothetical protein
MSFASKRNVANNGIIKECYLIECKKIIYIFIFLDVLRKLVSIDSDQHLDELTNYKCLPKL